MTLEPKGVNPKKFMAAHYHTSRYRNDSSFLEKEPPSDGVARDESIPIASYLHIEVVLGVLHKSCIYYKMQEPQGVLLDN
jgi:hypothetical protein